VQSKQQLTSLRYTLVIGNSELISESRILVNNLNGKKCVDAGLAVQDGSLGSY